MEPDNAGQGEKEQSLYNRLKNSIIPANPIDSPSKKMLKEGGFYLFLVMLALITGAVGLAIAFVL